MTPPEWSSLLPALLEFERSPGRYRVVLREPRPLFEHIGSVMLLASGRPPAGMPTAPGTGPDLRRAARFFVRTVMLRPGADPFTLLGLNLDFEPTRLREHYRLMIRLTHPDFEVGGECWPADAATRVNLAHDLLSSPEKRAGYTGAWRTGASMHTRPLLPGPALARDNERAVGWSPRAKLALVGTGAVLMAAAFVLIGPVDNEGNLTVHRALPVQDPESQDDRPVVPRRLPGLQEREALQP